MVDSFTERHHTLFSLLHPTMQDSINDLIDHLRQINLKSLESGRGFLVDNVLQIVISDNVVFQAVLGAQDIIFDLHDVEEV